MLKSVWNTQSDGEKETGAGVRRQSTNLAGDEI